MYNMFTVFALCACCFLIGCILTMIGIMRLFLHAHDEYSEKDDWPDEDWAKDYEECKEDIT